MTDCPDGMKTFRNPLSSFTGLVEVLWIAWMYSWTVAMPGVGHGDRGGDLASMWHLVSAQGYVGIGERSVAQTVSERIQRSVQLVNVAAGKLAVGDIVGMRPACVLVVVVQWQLAHRTGKAGRQLGRRVCVSEDHVGNGVASLDAGAPDGQDGVGERLDLRQDQRTSRNQHDNQRFPRGLDGLQQLYLAVRNRDVRARSAFAVHAGDLTDACHYDVCRDCLHDGFGNQYLLGPFMNRRDRYARRKHADQSITDPVLDVCIPI